MENVPWRQDAAFLEGRTDALRRKKWWLRVGWPVGALGAATLAAIALTINGIVLIWIYNTFKFEHGVAEVFAGDCHGSETINTWVHLGINAVSTMLLSGSNYCMQILSAPTRKEVDKAHAKQKWLDIGVPSVRNLKSVAWSKILMWWLLGLSSIPLHLMYNSVFFSTLATNEYKLVFANETFVEGGPNSAYDKKRFKRIEDIQAQVKTWDRLENAACINAYATEFLSTRRDLVVVVVDDEVTENASVKRVEDYLFDFNQDFPGEFDPYGWICDSNDGITLYGFTQKENEREYHCSAKVSKVKANANRWRFDKWDIEYCLSEPVETKCSLNFSLPIIVVVMTCNVGKALIMFYVAFRVRDKPLITVGDAINSFLSDNDPSTAGMCLANKESIKAAAEPITYCENPRDFTYENPYLRWKWEKLSLNWEPGPTVYKSSVKRWSKATSSSRWWSCMVL